MKVKIWNKSLKWGILSKRLRILEIDDLGYLTN